MAELAIHNHDTKNPCLVESAYIRNGYVPTTTYPRNADGDVIRDREMHVKDSIARPSQGLSYTTNHNLSPLSFDYERLLRSLWIQRLTVLSYGYEHYFKNTSE